MTHLIEIIPKAIEKSTPLARPSKLSMPGFNEDWKEAQMRARHLKKVYQKTGSLEAFKEFERARHHKGKVIQKAKRKEFRKSREKMCESIQTMWKACRYAKNTSPRQPCLPEIARPDRSLEGKPEAKVNLLKSAFFPPPTLANLDDIQRYKYPQPHLTPSIMHHEIKRAIKRASSKSAPGSDQIPNKILKDLLPEILD